MVQKRLKSGNYKVQVRVGGKRVTHTLTSKADAEAKEAELKRTQAMIRAGMEVPTESVLLLDYGPAWLRKQDRAGMPLSTLRFYARNMKIYIMPRLGAYPLPQITSAMVLKLLDDAQEAPWKFNPKQKTSLSNAKRNRIRATLSVVLQTAFEEGKVIVNPVARCPLLDERKTQKPKVPPLTREEAEKFMPAGYELSEQDGFLAVLFIFTGGRVSQMSGLQNGDFDLLHDELHFLRICEAESGTIVPRIKGHPDGITIPLFPVVRQAFERHMKETKFRGPKDFCLTDPSGQFLDTYQIGRRVRMICERAGIREISPHVLRATFATHGEEAGLSKEDLQLVLGHTSVLVTQRYTRRTAQPLREKAKKLGFGAIGKKRKGKK
jgi:integrase/recombinase XerD